MLLLALAEQAPVQALSAAQSGRADLIPARQVRVLLALAVLTAEQVALARAQVARPVLEQGLRVFPELVLRALPGPAFPARATNQTAPESTFPLASVARLDS